MARRENGGCIGAAVLFLFWILEKIVEAIIKYLGKKSRATVKIVNIVLLVLLTGEIIACFWIAYLIGWI
ncbi:hypothetical protein [Phocaeicola sartorii]|uniref:hypothetical protein n=1 Tax=Phocaeicola sartorii TaxID=671267 RepID=UPI0026707595|nr:hypothetical protein [Phocaeicola sartorii]